MERTGICAAHCKSRFQNSRAPPVAERASIIRAFALPSGGVLWRVVVHGVMEWETARELLGACTPESDEAVAALDGGVASPWPALWPNCRVHSRKSDLKCNISNAQSFPSRIQMQIWPTLKTDMTTTQEFAKMAFASPRIIKTSRHIF